MNKIEKLFLYITSTLLFLSMFIMGFSSVCHAAGSTLPYIIDSSNYINADDYTLSDLQEFYNNRWGSFYPLDFSSDNVLIFDYQEWHNEIMYDFTVVCVPNSSSSFYYFSNWSNPYSLLNYDTDNVYINFVGYSSVTFSKYRNQYNDSTLGVYNNNFSRRIFGSYGFPSYCKGDFFDNSYSGSLTVGSNIVITDNVPYSPDIPTVGHATQPTNDPNNFINGSNGQPVTRPTPPTINNYTWNTWTSPSVDTSSVESLLESLIDVVSSLLSWLGSNISGEFQNLLSNLQNFFDFLVQGIENGFNKVISAIQGLGTDLYNNFVSLFEPITQQLSYISAPVDIDLIQGEVESTALMSDYSEVVSIKDSFVSVFTDTSEPSSFMIPIHLENLSMLNVGTQYIDLSVINPVKSALRTFIWVLVSFGLVVTIIDSIPNYINGGGDE